MNSLQSATAILTLKVLGFFKMQPKWVQIFILIPLLHITFQNSFYYPIGRYERVCYNSNLLSQKQQQQQELQA